MKVKSTIATCIFFISGLANAQIFEDAIVGCLRVESHKARIDEQHNDPSLDVDKLRVLNYKIPTVIHVFHDGDVGKLTNEQVVSGLEVINQDFQGLNQDWNDVLPMFDSIKSRFSLELCLATKDENGIQTTGIIYYDDAEAAYFEKDVTQYAWDNYKYLNIYLPIYVYDQPSNRTAFTNLPSAFFSRNGKDGIFYSSVRWGYGEHSELEAGSEIASIATHEMGHWLNLRHTFNNECEPPGDFVDDTPPDDNSEINFESCDVLEINACGGVVNVSNYMAYNHGCKKMFTNGQVERMLRALQLPERKPLWSLKNLLSTGCIPEKEEFVQISYSVVDGYSFIFNELPVELKVFDLSGRIVLSDVTSDQIYQYKPNSALSQDVLIVVFKSENEVAKRKILIR